MARRAKSERRKKGKPEARAAGGWAGTRTRWVPLSLFVVALLLRLLFWQATPDRHWPHSLYYKGDAPTWMAYAQALEQGRPFELGLPIRPPGNAYLLALLGGGEPGASVAPLVFTWCLLGALTVVLLHGAVRRFWGDGLALWVGSFCAVSSALMVLSTSLNNETPYLLLVAATLRWWPAGRAVGEKGGKPVQALPLASWGGLQALACLFRVEHLLVFALTGLHLSWRWLGTAEGAEQPRLAWAGRRSAAVLAGFVLVLLPWQLHAWRQCRDFNRAEPVVDAATEQAFSQVEQAVAGIAWSEGARDELEAMPAASRRTMRNFVAATVLVRGGQRVEAGDVDRILGEAFGSVPRPIGELPLVSLYGGLNFYLAHHPAATTGFSRAPLDAPPPLSGGVERYPRALLAGLPPPDLALTYPPHLEIVNHGYALGLAAIREHPARALRRSLAKLVLLWQGATLGVGGYDLPWGFEGMRRRVDLLVPSPHFGIILWQLAWLALALLGCWHARGRPELFPWLALLVGKLVATVAFFGYARHGATLVPVVVLLAALGLRSLLARRSDRPAWLSRPAVPLALVAALLVLELFRFLAPPTATLDGRSVGPHDPWPIDRHEDRRIEWP